MRVSLLLGFALTIAACSDDPRRTTDNPRPTSDAGCTPGTSCTPEDSGTGPTCGAADYSARADAICATNHPDYAPRAFGADCVDDTQCDSGLCADRFTGRHYCSIDCPLGNECPNGFSCDESGRVDGVSTLCFESVCVYGGTDRADCTNNLLDDVEAACGEPSTCAGELESWVSCLESAGRLCGPGEACTVERDALERCCPFCSPDRW